jgi:hypothetical protein
MKNLKYFIFGSAFAIAFISVFEKFIELIMLWVEVLKIKPSVKLLNYQKDTVVLKEFLKPTSTIYNDEDNDYEDFDDSEDEE